MGLIQEWTIGYLGVTMMSMYMHYGMFNHRAYTHVSCYVLWVSREGSTYMGIVYTMRIPCDNIVEHKAHNFSKVISVTSNSVWYCISLDDICLQYIITLNIGSIQHDYNRQVDKPRYVIQGEWFCVKSLFGGILLVCVTRDLPERLKTCKRDR